MEKKEISPHIIALYDFLVANHLGEEKKIKKSVLAFELGINERLLRKFTQYINSDPQFDKIISTKHGCFICNNREEAEDTIRNTYNMAISLIKKAKVMEQKVGLNGQIRMNLDNAELTDIIKTFGS